MRKVGITTTDNPYNPITQFDDWYAFDEQKGYHTCSYLARIVDTKVLRSDSIDEQNAKVESAIDEIVSLNVLGLYAKVVLDS